MTRRLWRTCFIAFVSLATVTSWGEMAASAQPKNASEKAALDVRARELFQKGDTAYAEGRYEEALAAFQEAHELSGRPQLLFNVSNALERLGRYAEAVDALEKYLASGKAKDRDVVQKRLANLRKRVEDQKKVDEKNKEEEERRRAEEKKKADEQAAEAARRAAQQAGDNNGGNGNGNNGGTKTPPPKEKPTRILPIVLLGGGALAFAGAGVFGALTLSARSDVNAGCKDAPGGKLCTQDASSAIDRDKTFGLITDIALVSGVVLAGAGVYFLIAGGDDDDTKAKADVKVGRSSGSSSSEPRVGEVRSSEPRHRYLIEARPLVARDQAGVVVVGTF